MKTLLAAALLALVGQPAKDFAIPQLNGATLHLSDFKGKIVVLEFLLTHCPACQATGRVLMGLQQAYGPRNLVVVGVAVDKEAANGMAKYRALSGATFPIGIRTEDDFRGYMGYSTFDRPLFPQLLVIDRAGIIRAHHGGLGDESFLMNEERILRSDIDKILAEKKPVPGAKK